MPWERVWPALGYGLSTRTGALGELASSTAGTSLSACRAVLYLNMVDRLRPVQSDIDRAVAEVLLLGSLLGDQTVCGVKRQSNWWVPHAVGLAVGPLHSSWPFRSWVLGLVMRSLFLR